MTNTENNLKPIIVILLLVVVIVSGVILLNVILGKIGFHESWRIIFSLAGFLLTGFLSYTFIVEMIKRK